MHISCLNIKQKPQTNASVMLRLHMGHGTRRHTSWHTSGRRLTCSASHPHCHTRAANIVSPQPNSNELSLAGGEQRRNASRRIGRGNDASLTQPHQVWPVAVIAERLGGCAVKHSNAHTRRKKVPRATRHEDGHARRRRPDRLLRGRCLHTRARAEV